MPKEFSPRPLLGSPAFSAVFSCTTNPLQSEALQPDCCATGKGPPDPNFPALGGNFNRYFSNGLPLRHDLYCPAESAW